jgi:Fe-S-cluster containining protein
MEIVIDLAMVRRLIAQEYREASADILTAGPVRACEKSQHRHDERLASAPDASTLACTAGCSWCCHFTVDVRAFEVLRLLEYIDTRLSAAERARVQAEIEINRQVMEPLDDLKRVQTNIKCPFLAEGRCTVYAARPQTCRNYHATDAAGCQRSFEEPDNIDIDPEFAPGVYQRGGAHVEAFAQAMKEAGYDTAVYEMNTALSIAMRDPQLARQRFESKQSLFEHLAGAEVDGEFGSGDESD